jgi:hypothetical protein
MPTEIGTPSVLQVTTTFVSDFGLNRRCESRKKSVCQLLSSLNFNLCHVPSLSWQGDRVLFSQERLTACFNGGAFSHRDRVGDPLLPAGDVRRVHRGAEPARGNGRELRGPGVRLRQLLRERRAERQQAFFF